MIRDKRIFLPAVFLFLALELSLSVLLHTVGGGWNAHLSYAVVLLAFLFCFLFAERSGRYLLTQIALLFTAVSDWYLVLHPERGYLTAMLFFTVVQLAYGARLLLEDRDRVRLHLGLRLFLSLLAVSIAVLVAGEAVDALALVSMFYFANLVSNAVLALINIRENPILAAGLVLFVLCDIFVGFGMLGSYIPLPTTPLIEFLSSPPLNMAWVFYAPSQTMLALSLA